MRFMLSLISSVCLTVCCVILGGTLITGIAFGDLDPGGPPDDSSIIDCNTATCDGTCTIGTGPCGAPCGSCNCSGDRGIFFCTD